MSEAIEQAIKILDDNSDPVCIAEIGAHIEKLEASLQALVDENNGLIISNIFHRQHSEDTGKLTQERDELLEALTAWKSAEDYGKQYNGLSDTRTEIADAHEYAVGLRDKALDTIKPVEIIDESADQFVAILNGKPVTQAELESMFGGECPISKDIEELNDE